MENIAIIDFHRTRDFGRKLNATFEFVKQNFKSFGKSILYIAGPPVLIASLLIGSFYGEFLRNTMAAATSGYPADMESFMSPSFWAQIVFMMVFFFIGFVAILATTNSYIILYEEKQTNQISVEEVWARVRSTFFMYLGTIILYYVLLVAACVVVIIPLTFVAQGSFAIAFFGFLAVGIGFFYLTVGTVFIFFIRAYEKVGFIEAVNRSLYLVRGKWWSTFGLILVLSLVGGVVAYIFLIPWYAITLTTTLHDVTSGTVTEPSSTMQIISTVLMSLYYLTVFLMYALPYVGIAFQYFNLVEMKESKGLMNQIGNLGQADQNPAPANEDF